MTDAKQHDGAGERWTVRGVPRRVQRAALVAAKAEGVAVGVWLARVIVNDPGATSAAAIMKGADNG